MAWQHGVLYQKHPPIFLHSLSLHSRADAGFEPVSQVLPALPVSVCLQVTGRLCIPRPHPAEHCQGKRKEKKEENFLYNTIPQKIHVRVMYNSF